MAVFDMKLPNGFRAVAVIPPEALGVPATAAFVRETTIPVPKEIPKEVLHGAPTASTSNGAARAVPGSVMASPHLPGSALIATPPPRSGPTDSPAHFHAERDPLARYRARILERLLTKFASIGLYDVQKLDVNELRKVISAYVSEYAADEKIYLSDPDQGRLTLEILTSLRK